MGEIPLVRSFGVSYVCAIVSFQGVELQEFLDSLQF